MKNKGNTRPQCSYCGQFIHSNHIECYTQEQRINNGIIQHIIKEACRFMKIDEKEIFSKSRAKNLVMARSKIMHLLYCNRNLNLFKVDIGLIFNKDHSSVIHSLRVVKNYMEIYEDFRDELIELHAVVYGHLHFLNLTGLHNEKLSFINKIKG